MAPQVGEPTYAEKIDASELRIDWSRSAHEISRLIRLGNAWTIFRGKRLKVHHAIVVDVPSGEIGSLIVTKNSANVATGNGILDLKIVQPEGKPRMDVVSWINGNQPTHGEKLTSD